MGTGRSEALVEHLGGDSPGRSMVKSWSGPSPDDSGIDHLKTTNPEATWRRNQTRWLAFGAPQDPIGGTKRGDLYGTYAEPVSD